MSRVKLPKISRTMVAHNGTKFKITNQITKSWRTRRAVITISEGMYGYAQTYRFSKKQLLHWYHGILKMLMLEDMANGGYNDDD